MSTWETIPKQGKFKVIKNSNHHIYKIGKIYNYDTSMMQWGMRYDIDGIREDNYRFKEFYERSATDIVADPKYKDSFLLLSDVEIQKPKKDYFNKKLFKKL